MGKTPIDFVVPVGAERLLSFPGRIVIHNTNPRLSRDKVTLYNNQGTLYVHAHKAFQPILLPVTLLDSGNVVLVYLSSRQAAKDRAPLDVVVPGVSTSAYQAGAYVEKPTRAINAVTLLRFAAREFSLKRLMQHPRNITRTPMYTHPTVNIYYGDSVQAFPVSSWRGGDLYVTAVLLKNTTHERLLLHAKNLVGDWQAASFYRFDRMKNFTTPVLPFNTLMPQGEKRDFTLLFVVSTKTLW